MSLFSKKMSLEDILKAIEGLSEEEKAQVKAKMEESKEVPEEPIEKPEEPQGDITEERSEEPVEEPIPETNEVPEEPTEEVEEEGVEGVEETPEGVPQTDELNGVEQENKEDVLHGISDRLQALEEKLAEFEELKTLMEQFTKKQADNFGYKGAVPGAKKDIHEMSASELKQKMLNGEI